MTESNQSLYPTFAETYDQIQFRQLYQEKIWELYRFMDTSGLMDIKEGRPISLTDIYVPIRFGQKDMSSNENENEIDAYTQETLQLHSLLQKYPQVILSGYPGSGKSTLTRLLTYALSSPNPTDIAVSLGKKLALPFILREYNTDLKSADDLFDSFIEQHERILNIKIPKDMLEFYMRNGWACMIFDGIDEVGSTERRNEFKSWILEKFSQYHPDNIIIITGRPIGFQDCSFEIVTGRFGSTFPFKFGSSQKLAVFHLQPFSKDEVELFGKKWFNIREADPKKKIEKADNFIKAIEKHKGLIDLKRKPIFLTLMAYIHGTQGELPYTNAVFYEWIIKVYFQILDQVKGLKELEYPEWSMQNKLIILEEIAYRCHKESSKLEEEINFVYDRKKIENIIIKTIDSNKEDMECGISNNEYNKLLENKHIKKLEKSLLKISNKNNMVYIKCSDIEKYSNKSWYKKFLLKCSDSFIKYLLSRTELLWEPKKNKIKFSNLIFQDFLTAKRIYRYALKDPFNMGAYLKRELFEPLKHKKWVDVGLLFFSIYKQQSQGGHQILLNNLLEAHPQHYRFLIQLLSSTETNLSEKEKKDWILEILYFVIIKEEIGQLGKDLGEYFIDELSELQPVKYWIKECLQIAPDNILAKLQSKLHRETLKKIKNTLSAEKQIACILLLINYSTYLPREFIGLIAEKAANKKFIKNNIYVMDLFSLDSDKIFDQVIYNIPLKDLILKEGLNYHAERKILYSNFSSPIKDLWILSKNIEIMLFGLNLIGIKIDTVRILFMNRTKNLSWDWDIFFGIDHILSQNRNIYLAHAKNKAIHRANDMFLDLTMNSWEQDKNHSLELVQNMNRNMFLDQTLDLERSLLKTFDMDMDLTWGSELGQDLPYDLLKAMDFALDRNLVKAKEQYMSRNRNMVHRLVDTLNSVLKLYSIRENKDFLEKVYSFLLYWNNLITLLVYGPSSKEEILRFNNREELEKLKSDLESKDFVHNLNRKYEGQDDVVRFITQEEYEDYIQEPWSVLSMVNNLLELKEIPNVSPERVNERFGEQLEKFKKAIGAT